MATTRISGIPYAAAPRAEAVAAVLAQPPRLVVIHDTGNPTSTAAGEASFAHTRTDAQSHWTSAHAYIDQDGPLGSLRLDRQAWAAYSYANSHGIHLELCLTGNQAATRQHAAELTRQLCDLFDIPKVKLTPSRVAAGESGVCGHKDITEGLGVGDHTDPGANFPWSAFMATVNGTTASGGSTMAVEVTTSIGQQYGENAALLPPEWSTVPFAPASFPFGDIIGGLHRRVYVIYTAAFAIFAQAKSNGIALTDIKTKVNELTVAVGQLRDAAAAGGGTGGTATALADADVQRIAKAVVDEEHRRSES